MLKDDKKDEKATPNLPVVISETETQLPMKLSAERKHELQEDLAKAAHERIALQNEKRTTMKRIGSQIEGTEMRMAIASEALVTGVEMKAVKCQVIADVERKMIVKKNTGDGKVVHERQMSREEQEVYCGSGTVAGK